MRHSFISAWLLLVKWARSLLQEIASSARNASTRIASPPVVSHMPSILRTRKGPFEIAFCFVLKMGKTEAASQESVVAPLVVVGLKL